MVAPSRRVDSLRPAVSTLQGFDSQSTAYILPAVPAVRSPVCLPRMAAMPTSSLANVISQRLRSTSGYVMGLLAVGAVLSTGKKARSLFDRVAAGAMPGATSSDNAPSVGFDRPCPAVELDDRIDDDNGKPGAAPLLVLLLSIALEA